MLNEKVITMQPDSKQTNVLSLHENFNLHALNASFYGKNILERLHLIHDWFTAHNQGKIALSSSFGVQSALLLHYAQESGLNIPVISVDINETKYDTQRAYKQTLQNALGFPLIEFQAKSDADKVEAMEQGLRAHFITGTIAGIRASQTQTRANKDFVEYNPRSGRLCFHPLLDWNDSKTNYYIEKRIPEHLRHPDYKPGQRSKGGVILSDDEEKTECGLHYP